MFKENKPEERKRLRIRDKVISQLKKKEGGGIQLWVNWFFWLLSFLQTLGPTEYLTIFCRLVQQKQSSHKDTGHSVGILTNSES